jgi:hypothetical protein
MAGLPHWDNSEASRNSYEPIFQNQFEFIINPPTALAADAKSPLLVEHILKLSGIPEQLTPGTVTQYYKFAKRMYSGAVPNETIAKLSCTFEVNLDDENNMYVYNSLRAWGDLIYDPLTGRQGLKKDYTGSAKLVIFNKAGDIFREFTFVNMFLDSAINAISLDYTSTTIYQLTASFTADTWRETRVGQIAV